MDGTLLIRNGLVVTMDDDRRELAGCDVLVDGRAIVAVGPRLAAAAGETIDATGCVLLPGLVNTHNHIFQTLYRTLPQTQQAGFLDWEDELSRLLLERPLPPEALRVAAQVAFAEMLLTGCTTSSDQHYYFPRDGPADYVEREIEAALELGHRFHPARGCLTLGSSEGGVVPDALTESEDDVLAHCERLIAAHHDPGPFSMTRLVLAPTGIYSDSERMYRETAALARRHPGVHLHTHLYELADEQYSLERYGIRPLEFMEHAGWVGTDVVFYHVVNPTSDEVVRLAANGSFVSHCVAPDLRMGYGLTPVRELLDAGANLCLGTTGAAANDGANMVADLRLCLLTHRLRSREPARWLSARELLWMATRGGAAALGRDELGSIEPGKGADIAIFDVSGVDFAGNHDPVAALLFMGTSHRTRATIVNGRIVARDGRLALVDQDEIAREANSWARRLVG